MRLIRTGLFATFFLFFSTIAFGQQKYPSTLLWKISRPGLTQPSYIYGTMHMQDRRLFYFGDSVYAAIEKTAGFAIEINPDEMMDSIFRSMGKEDTSALLKKILSETEYKKIEKQLEKKFKTAADKITTKKLAQEKKRMKTLFKKKDDMPAIMDLYLFSIARKQGKVTGGIEDLADQFEITDEIGKFDVYDFIKDDSALRFSYMESMLKIYVNNDLTSLDMMVNGNLESSYKDLLLIKRNRKMAMRMDSLSHVRTTFFAVGAAHLPGDSGLITLLQQKGYQVDPVFSSKNIAPENYTYTAKEPLWLKVEDENKMCSVYMPGTPSDVMLQGTLPLKMYMDMGEMDVYGITVTPLSEEEAKSDSVFDRIIANYKKAAYDIQSIKKISYKNSRGIEMYAIQEGAGEYRYRMLINGNKLFIIIFGGSTGDNLYSAQAERFFSSLSFNEENMAADQKWQLFTNEKNAFSMLVPGKTAASKERDDDGELYDQYTSVDYSDGTYYMTIIRDTKAGYYIENDSIYFDDYKKNMESNPAYRIKEFNTLKFKDYNACHFRALQQFNGLEILLEGYLIRRGARTYLPMVVMPKEKADFPQITNFFRSFTPLPFKTGEWKKQVLPGTGISLFTPAPFIMTVADSTGFDFNPDLKKFIALDNNTAESYSAEIEILSPYYWSNSDSAFFINRANRFKDFGDSILSWHYTDGPVKEGFALIQKSNTALFKKLKFFLNGDTLYTFFAFQNDEGLKHVQAQKYFTEIHFSQQYPTTIFVNKAAALLKAIASEDSAVATGARDVLNTVEFTRNDLPLLYSALSKKYKSYQTEFRSVNEVISGIITGLNDSSVVDVVRAQYNIINDSTGDVQMLMLGLLASQKTATSYKLLKQLFLEHSPKSGNSYSVINALLDTLNLAKDLFPEVTALFGDTVIGGGIAKLAIELLDSSVLSIEKILQNENGLINLAQKQYEEIKNDEEAYPVYNVNVIALLGRFNTKQSNDMLYTFLSLPDKWVKQNAILALLRNNNTVPGKHIREFAADREWRTSFYESLQSINKTAVFPKAFYSQLKFAESYLYNSLMEYYELDAKSMQFVKEKTAEINGKQKRFYVFKIILNDDAEKTPRFAICGAFDMNKDIAEIKEEEQDVFLNYEEVFSLSKLDEVFKKYIDEKIKNRKTD